ncbi:MAG: hypothetical protein SFU98_19810 [Leptospiraceae bacterium]|nr:hypothetical protein [Leptospiraceae bacterium]
MGNLFWLNSAFEFQLRNFPNSYVLPSQFQDKFFAYEYLFASLSQSTDYVLITGKELNEQTISSWTELFNQEINFFDKNKINSSTLNLVEWGKFYSYTNGDLISNEEKWKESSFLNSKITQANWKSHYTSNELNSCVIDSTTNLKKYFKQNSVPIVLKEEFGFSGIGNKIITKKNLDLEIQSKEKFVIEKWAETRTKDFSGLFDVKDRNAKFLSLTEMKIGKNGAFLASHLEPDQNELIIVEMQNFINSLLYQEKIDYVGPISIDGFEYFDEGKFKLQIFSEINFRFSMGRVLYEIRKRRNAEKKSCSLFFAKVKIKTKNELLDRLNKFSSINKIFYKILTPILQRSSSFPIVLYLESNEGDVLDTFLEILPLILT